MNADAALPLKPGAVSAERMLARGRVVTVDWRAALDAARQPPTPAQTAWDERWQTNYDIALGRGRTPVQAA